jgi:putative transposase
MRVKIIRRMRMISKIQSILDKGYNKNGMGIKNKKVLKQKMARLYKNIQGYVNEIHKKAANYLCKNYKNILLPEFKTKPMISNKKKESELGRIDQIKNKQKKETELKQFKKEYKMSAEVKYVLSMQSHYKFKKYLKAKAKEYGAVVYDVTEEYTSQVCTKCGRLSKNYDKNRMKQCICRYKIDRDINGQEISCLLSA